MLFLHENVLGFPLTLSTDILKELYEVEELVITPEIANFPVERRRKYAVGRFRLSLRTFGAKVPLPSIQSGVYFEIHLHAISKIYIFESVVYT